LFEKTDLNLLHKIDAICTKKISFEQGKKEFIEIGEEICKSVEFKDNKWNNYCNVVTLRTFTYYSRQVLHDLLYKLSNVELSDKQLDLKNYPDVEAIVKKIQEISRKHNDCFAFHEDTMTKFENYIKTKMKK
jgi:hypothetical protein